MEATSKVMLLALSQNEVSLLRLALQAMMGGANCSHEETVSRARDLLGKLPSNAALLSPEGQAVS